MRAPAKLDVIVPQYVVRDGKKHYSQISDDLLFSWEADTGEGYYDGPSTIGQMIKRIREAEKDRDAALQALERALSVVEIQFKTNALARGVHEAIVAVLAQVNGK